MKRSGSFVVFLSLLVVGSHGAPNLNSGAFEILQHLGLDTRGGLPDITQGERIRQGDSPIYYIKLPPVPYYYVNNNLYQPPSSPLVTPSTSHDFEKVSIDFTSNGRPDQIYHWNKKPTISGHWNPSASPQSPGYWKPSSTTTTTTTTPPPTTTTTTTTTTTPKPTKKPWTTLEKYFPYNGRPSGIYIYKPRPSINVNKYKHRYFTHFNY